MPRLPSFSTLIIFTVVGILYSADIGLFSNWFLFRIHALSERMIFLACINAFLEWTYNVNYIYAYSCTITNRNYYLEVFLSILELL